MNLLESRRLKAGDLSHRQIAAVVRITATDGTQVRDILYGIIYGAEVGTRDEMSGLSESAPDTPNLLLAFKNSMPTNSYRYGPSRGRYFEVAADSVAVIYREDGDPDE